MRICRLSDGKEGHAFQMMGRWKLDSVFQNRYAWIVQLDGHRHRFATTTDTINSDYMEVIEP